MDIIIIEDEPLMARALASGIAVVRPGFQVRKMLGSIETAIAYFEQSPLPDLFFSDIELSDGLSFEIFNHIKNTAPVIFCTAYDQYALEAFRANGVDYILKPFDETSLKSTLDKFDALHKRDTASEHAIQALIETFSNKPRQGQRAILAHQGEKIIPVKVQDVAVASIEHDLCYLYTFGGKRFMTNRRLDSLEQTLGAGFYRANRQCIVNKEAIISAAPYFGRKLLVQVQVEVSENIIVSKAKASAFLGWLEEG